MKHIQVFCERNGRWMLLLALLFTFTFTFLYSAMYSCDYLYYMHLVDNGDYITKPMVAGTILFSKPFWTLFGHRLWIWRVWAWAMASMTAAIPFLTLLNKEQRKKYSYILALVVIVFNIRYGLEPPKYVYLFNTIMLTCFLNYVNKNKYCWIIITSVSFALIAFVRFPSLFTWPVVVLAMLIMKRTWWHTFLMAVLPILMFIGLVTLTNGSIAGYLGDLYESFRTTSSGGHSFMNLFMGYVTSTIHAVVYAVLISLPILLYALWKRKVDKWQKYGFMFFFGLIAAIMVVHPTEHLSCALTIVAVLLYIYSSQCSLRSISVGGTLVITNMFCSVGSDCGFVHDYYCASFIPYLLVNTRFMENVKCEMQEDAKKSRSLFKDICLTPIFASIVAILGGASLSERCMTVVKAYSSGMAHGKVLSDNLQGLLFSNKFLNECLVVQKEYLEQKHKSPNVIYWGTFGAHLMSFANSQWPVTDMWEISSEDKVGKAFRDFTKYVDEMKPTVIDLQKHTNTESFMLSRGYKVEKKDSYNLFVLVK